MISMYLCRLISHRLALLVSVLCIVQGSLSARQQDVGSSNDTLAMVDSWPITANDLFERIELMPFEVKTQEHDIESIKRKAVESLVGERLLGLAFKEADVHDPWHMDRVRAVLEKMLARDQMYKQEVRDRVSIRESEVQEGVKRYRIKRRLLIIRSRSLDEARIKAVEWRQSRRSGKSNAHFISSIHVQPDTVLISFASADTALEEAAYRLRDTLTVSDPVLSKLFGWTVATLLREEPNSEAREKSVAEQEKEVRQQLELRKESSIATEIVDRILRGKQMEADSAVFRMVAKRLWELIRSDTAARRVSNGYRYTPGDIYQLLNEFKMQLDRPIVRLSPGTLSLGDFLEYLFHYDFTIPSLHPQSFVVSFFEILRTITESEMIAQEALRQGYQHNEEILRDESKWMDYWKSRYAELSAIDTVTYIESEPYWSLWRYHTALVESTCVLNVQEVLRSDSVSAAWTLNMIRGGASMDSVARKYSIRKEWAERGGKSGWFGFNEYKALSSRLMMLDLGNIGGPFSLAEGFAVVRLLGRKLNMDSTLAKSLLEDETRRIVFNHDQSVINRYVAHLAMGRRVEIYYDRIKTTEIVDVNMFTRRTLGFGGRMNAAPVLIPQWQWIDEWQRMRQLMQ